MSRLLKQIVNAAILTTLLAIIAVVIKNKPSAYVDQLSIVLLLPSFFLICSLSLTIFNIGMTKPADVQSLFTLSAIGIKFFLVAILALVYFVTFKKSELEFVLLFFILYLTFTFYLIRVILKTLNNRSLKKE